MLHMNSDYENMKGQKMNINLDILNNFVVVAKTENLSAAAKKLGATQPNLGRQMTALAKEINLTLFDRHSRGVSLTDGGKQFLILSQTILGQLKYETDLIREQAQGLNGSLRIMKSLGATGIILDALSLFRKKHPKVQFSITSAADVSDLHMADIDVGILPALPNDPELLQRHLYDFGVRLYAAPRYFERRGMPKTLDDLKNHNVVFCESPVAGADSPFNFHASVTNFSSSVEVSEEMVEEFLRRGWGITPFPSNNKLEGTGIIDVFPDMPDHKVPVYFTHHKRLEESPNVEAFYECLKEVAKALERAENIG